MHGHDTLPFIEELATLSIIPIVILAGLVLFATGLVPIPVGYERGKIEWIMWCGTGMHAHIVYWTDNGFQTLHPADRSSGG